ncbi:MAG: TlpA disulfide reductase family protein [Nitriliruptor sp.]|uniref:TlpA family protein disulfide reductase n=1 Tax=Nitriliruptor sp. TaxID=2448056 RepID=UPI0034A06FBB
MRRTLVRLLVVATVSLAVGCGDGGGGGTTVVGPGAADPTPQASRVAVTDGLDLGAVEVAGDPPPRAPVLDAATWPQAAGWLRRETDARPVVVNFFASFCEPCKRELPLLLDTADAEPDVAFLGVHTYEQRALGERMVREYGITIPTLHDPDADVLAEVGGRVLPYTVAFDTDGRLVGRVIGELTGSSLDELLAEVRP